MEWRNCMVKPCPAECQYSKWSNWTMCSKSCGPGGVSARNRLLLQRPNTAADPNTVCGATTQTIRCNSHDCPVDCELKETTWSKWGRCDAPCDGVAYKRRVIKTYPTNGGKGCPKLRRAKTCNRRSCTSTSYKLQYPIDCEYEAKSDWGPCIADCKSLVSGLRQRTAMAKPSSRDKGCQDFVEEEPCVLPDTFSSIRHKLKKDLAGQLPPKELTDDQGRKMKVNVNLDVRVTHQGKDGKTCPLVARLKIT